MSIRIKTKCFPRGNSFLKSSKLRLLWASFHSFSNALCFSADCQLSGAMRFQVEIWIFDFGIGGESWFSAESSNWFEIFNLSRLSNDDWNQTSLCHLTWCTLLTFQRKRQVSSVSKELDYLFWILFSGGKYSLIACSDKVEFTIAPEFHQSYLSNPIIFHARIQSTKFLIQSKCFAQAPSNSRQIKNSFIKRFAPSSIERQHVNVVV